MRIESIDPTPIATVDSFTAGRGGRSVEHRRLPILQGTISGLPKPLEGIVATSDLQGYHSKSLPVAQRRLTGFCMSTALRRLAESGEIPQLCNMGLFLPGDYYAIAEMNRRGGLGDVQDVWAEFAKFFRWVAGVAGNHDSFVGGGSFKGVFDHLKNVHALEADIATADGIDIAGLSGIEGSERKIWHYSLAELASRLEMLIEMQPDVLVMHDGPSQPKDHKTTGCWYTDAMQSYEGLVVRGHRYWETPVMDIANFQIRNVDSRAVVLRAV